MQQILKGLGLHQHAITKESITEFSNGANHFQSRIQNEEHNTKEEKGGQGSEIKLDIIGFIGTIRHLLLLLTKGRMDVVVYV